MSFIELRDFMIYQQLNMRTKILPIAISHIAHLCQQFNHACPANFYATFQKHYFYQNSPKIKLLLQKKCKIFERGVLRLQTP